jgi:hypothetical protein
MHTSSPFFCPRLFWAQMALASLVPFQGPKKSRFLGPTPSNPPRNDVAPLKTITYRAIKTTGTSIVIVLSCMGWLSNFLTSYDALSVVWSGHAFHHLPVFHPLVSSSSYTSIQSLSHFCCLFTKLGFYCIGNPSSSGHTFILF